MEEYLATLASVQEANVLFEHRADLVSADGLEECYQWVKSMLATDPT